MTEFFKLIGAIIQEKILKYYEEINLLCSIALILNPKVKFKSLKLMLKRFF